MLDRVKRFFAELLFPANDPVFHCDVYKDKANGSCSHVDGPLCDFPKCSILRDYRAERHIPIRRV